MALEQSLRAIDAFATLVRAGAVVAHNPESQQHRAEACRTVDQLGLVWTADISGSRAWLAEAVGATVRALAAAVDKPSRTAIAAALQTLVLAARTGTPLPVRRRVPEPPHRWWTDNQH